MNLHVDALLKAKVLCKDIFSDIASGVKDERKGLDELLPRLRERDTLIVWKMDRVAKSPKSQKMF
ncbi:MAG: recombinase family protein [Arenibacter latericius]|nr:recombinase family protein [Arenibacter latericius]